MAEIITFSTSRDLCDKVDKLRGDIARSKFISRLIEDAIRKHMGQSQVPTMTGQSLERPDQSVGKKSIQRGGPTDG
jgi:hypothetical protein